MGRHGRWFSAAAALAAVLPFAAAAAPGDGDFDGAVSRPAFQTSPSRATYDLNAALSRLAQNPNDLEALIAAGNAALALGDGEAAQGFFVRASQLAPGNPRLKASQAAAMVRSENPYEALRLFDEAERAGAHVASLAGDRGLAYDLVGANAEAQRFYRQALAAGANDEISQRLALSLAIAGDRKQFETVLLPQLQRKVPGAWRARAFGLAILGAEQEAVTIASTTMPRQLSQGIIPYLRHMPRLTRAQQAAAANFGHFPPTAQIGRDDPRVARYASVGGRSVPRGADAGLIPAGEPLGTRGKARSRKDEARPDRRRSGSTLATAPRRPSPPVAGASQPANLPPAFAARSAALPPAAVPARPAPAPVAPRPQPAMQPPMPAAGPQAPASAPPGNLLPPAASLPPATLGAMLGPGAGGAASPVPPGPGLPRLTVPAAPPVLAPPLAGLPAPPLGPALAATTAAQAGVASVAQGSLAPLAPAAGAPASHLASAFSDFRPPASEQAARSGGDVPGIPAPVAAAPARLASGPPPVAKVAPSEPSRVWVQIGTGRERAALAADWRRLMRQSPEAWEGRKPWLSRWGQTNRLLVGPFASQSAAQAFLNRSGADEVGAFVWTSPAGQPVEALPPR